MLKNIKTKLDDLYEWITADTTPGLRLFSVTLVVWATIMGAAHIVACFVN
jgi:hypothetical protein